MRELSHYTSRIVNRVRTGEVIEVTDHGKPILRLVPITEGEGLRERLIAEGRLRPARREGLPDEISTAPPDVVMSDIVSEMRDEERF